MRKVFFGGSRKIGRLNAPLRERLRNLTVNQLTVLIGDANGADKAVQSFLAEAGYRNVVVYCMDGECRNNVGQWPVEAVDSGGKRKDFAYFALKDAEMSRAADYGFMVWDGESKGTMNNVLNLLQQGKPVLLYHSPGKEYFPLKSLEDLEPVLEGCPAGTVAHLDRKIALERRLSTAPQVSFDL